MIIRLKGGYPEGICYAILLMNCLTPALGGMVQAKEIRPAQTGAGCGREIAD